MKIKVRSPYNYDADEVSRETGLALDPDEDLTIQSYYQETDINELVKRFGITGDLPVARELAEYGDFSEVVDFQTGMEQLRRGQEAFEQLPAKIRDHFKNDPGLMWEFLHSEDIDGAVELGLLDPRSVPQDGPADVGAREGGAEAPPGNPPTP